MRLKLLAVLVILLMSATTSVANPGGEGDDVRSRDCAGSCHADPSINGQTDATLTVNNPGTVYSGLLVEITTSIQGATVSSSNLMGMALLVNDDGAKDLPANTGWEVVTDPNGGTNNYVEVRGDFSDDTRSWTLRAPSTTGTYSLYLAVQHGSSSGGKAMTGISAPTMIEVVKVPENLPRLAADWEPVNSRTIGEETVIEIETEDVDSIEVEIKQGSEVITMTVDDSTFTVPAALNPGVVEWRVVMHGEGPSQTSPWFRLTAVEQGWEVDEMALYLQGIAVLLLCAALVNIKRPDNEIETKVYDNTDQIATQSVEPISLQPESRWSQQPTQQNSGPPLPPEGLPAGWTMEQWIHYGQEHLDRINGGGGQ